MPSILNTIGEIALRGLENRLRSSGASGSATGFVRDFQHRVNGAWNRYTVQMDCRDLDWKTMLRSAEYLRTADLDSLNVLTVGDAPGTPNRNLFRQYEKDRGSLTRFPPLREEQTVLSVGGHSRALGSQVELVWEKNTKSLRLYTMLDDKKRVQEYVENVIRRSFGS